MVRPPWPPRAASRCVRSVVARGNMPYSAVTQPWPLPRSHGGTRSSTLAVHNTRVSPKLTSTEPSAWRVKWRWIVTARSWSGARPEGRVELMQVSAQGATVYHRLLQRLRGAADDPQHDRLRECRGKRRAGLARVRTAGGQPPLPRDRRTPARRTARAG